MTTNSHEPVTIWFMKGYSNLYHAINDIKQGDVEGNFKVLCSHTNPAFVGFESADYVETEPSVSDQKFLEFCEKMIIKYDVKVIFAANKQVLINKNKKLFEKYDVNIATVASSRMIPTINNKAKLYKLLDGNGIINIPEYAVFNNQKEFDVQYKKLKKDNKPLCMKPTHGVYGLGFYVLKEKSNDLHSFLNQTQTVSVRKFKSTIANKKIHQMILMQFLEGSERSVDCVAVNGVLVDGVIRKKNPGNVPQLIEENPQLMEQVKWLVKKLKLNGMFNVQFRDSQGKHYLLEINPRLSGRSFYATVAGFNIPYVASLLFSGKKQINELVYEKKTNFYINAVNSPVIAHKYAQHAPKHIYSEQESN